MYRRSIWIFCVLLTSLLAEQNEYQGCDYCCDQCTPDVTFGISAAYTYWTAREDGLLATLGYFANLTTAEELEGIDGGMVYPSWKFQSGFKVGLEISVNPWAMESYIEYTWFYNKGNSLSPIYTWEPGTPELFVVPKWFILVDQRFLTPPASNPTEWISEVANSWNNQFNRIDGILSKSYLIGRLFLYTVKFGPVGWWDTQWVDVMYKDSQDPANIITVKGTQNGWGIGPYMAYGLEFFFYRANENQLGLFADFGMGLLWSKFKATVFIQRAPSTTTFIPQDFILPQQNSRNVFWTTAPMLDMDIGLRWMMWCDESFNLLMQIGWELQAWFDHNHMFSSFMTRGSGVCNALYTMQGLTIKVMVGF